ncbi:hypothetical protein [Caulobacter mirabilis]|uniref:hypothetical protein n=1 Tax=Caulobacter mirabilis TaxID=69666 RepID=UPI001FE6A62A|nr:hypothetical protein [Caulobacter mirabilis]
MPTNAKTPLPDTEAVKTDLKNAAKTAERSFVEAADAARERLTEAAHRTEAAVREGLETLRAQSRAYADTAGEQFDQAQRYVVERVKERPVTATLAGVGVGLLIGLLLASRSDRR